MDTVAGTAGCGEAYECFVDPVTRSPSCLKQQDLNNNTDLPERLPRYHPCTVAKEALTQVYGLPILTFDNETAPQFPYLSTMGALDSNDPDVLARQAQVDSIFVMVHGSGRTVEDYLCSATAALPQSQQDVSSTTMVLAPWFMAVKDRHDVRLFNRTADTKTLRWSEFGPIAHTWRYGADAINKELYDRDLSVSSYHILDVLLQDYVLDDASWRFPNLQRIVVAGHSAGGQYVQRWALLTNTRVFTSSNVITTRVVVANPRSFCFLDERRMLPNGTFGAPDAATAADCDWYDQWEWGLGPGDALDVPYKTQAIQEAGGNAAVVKRYPDRDVVYLAGELDTIPNGDCQDKLQGLFRRVRSEHFFESLRRIFGRPVHHRLVVSGVPHDHSLMFQSPEGQQALWGTLLADNDSQVKSTV